MPSRPTILAVLSLPVGAIAYTVGAAVVTALDLPGGAFVVLLLPLFLAGLVMLPFLIPFFDRKATQDLAAYRASQAAAEPAATPTPTDTPEDAP